MSDSGSGDSPPGGSGGLVLLSPPETPRAATGEILVAGSGEGLPFSKGILSQSLLATAIDVSEAVAVARNIEQELLASGVRSISRADLRSLACSSLRRLAGDEAAERYLLWRRYREPERPVVLLLCGTSGVGKTSLSLEVSRRLGIQRVLSTDSIREIMRMMMLPRLAPALHASSYDAYLRLPHEAGRPRSVIDGFRAQAEAVSVGVGASIERTIAEGTNLAIDGVSLVPDLLDLEPFAGRAEIILLLVATLSEGDLRARFDSRRTAQRRPHRYVENLAGILAIQRHLLELAEQHAIPVIDNASFDLSVRTILGHVMQRLRVSSRRDSAL